MVSMLQQVFWWVCSGLLILGVVAVVVSNLMEREAESAEDSPGPFEELYNIFAEVPNDFSGICAKILGVILIISAFLVCFPLIILFFIGVVIIRCSISANSGMPHDHSTGYDLEDMQARRMIQYLNDPERTINGASVARNLRKMLNDDD
jgi:hypothetical protein